MRPEVIYKQAVIWGRLCELIKITIWGEIWGETTFYPPTSPFFNLTEIGKAGEILFIKSQSIIDVHLIPSFILSSSMRYCDSKTVGKQSLASCFSRGATRGGMCIQWCHWWNIMWRHLNLTNQLPTVKVSNKSNRCYSFLTRVSMSELNLSNFWV